MPWLNCISPDCRYYGTDRENLCDEIRFTGFDVDGGFADKLEKAKEYALRPGNHNIELRDSDGRTLFREQVAVAKEQIAEFLDDTLHPQGVAVVVEGTHMCAAMRGVP